MPNQPDYRNPLPPDAQFQPQGETGPEKKLPVVDEVVAGSMGRTINLIIGNNTLSGVVKPLKETPVEDYDGPCISLELPGLAPIYCVGIGAKEATLVNGQKLKFDSLQLVIGRAHGEIKKLPFGKLEAKDEDGYTVVKAEINQRLFEAAGFKHGELDNTSRSRVDRFSDLAKAVLESTRNEESEERRYLLSRHEDLPGPLTVVAETGGSSVLQTELELHVMGHNPDNGGKFLPVNARSIIMIKEVDRDGQPKDQPDVIRFIDPGISLNVQKALSAEAANTMPISNQDKRLFLRRDNEPGQPLEEIIDVTPINAVYDGSGKLVRGERLRVQYPVPVMVDARNIPPGYEPIGIADYEDVLDYKNTNLSAHEEEVQVSRKLNLRVLAEGKIYEVEVEPGVETLELEDGTRLSIPKVNVIRAQKGSGIKTGKSDYLPGTFVRHVKTPNGQYTEIIVNISPADTESDSEDEPDENEFETSLVLMDVTRIKFGQQGSESDV